MEETFPPHLASYEALAQHFRANLQGLNSTQKGLKFASSIRKLIPQTEAGADFSLPTLNPKISRDEGVDLKAIGKEDTHKILYIQSKLWVDRAQDIDGVLSNFQAFEQEQRAPHNGDQLSFNFNYPSPSFLLVTLSPLATLIKRYESRGSSSREFYEQCKAEQRIKFIDGYDILSVLQAAYIKISEPPNEVELKLESAVINKDNVFVGIVSSNEIKRLYNKIHDALFFENVRDFRGITPQDQKRPGRTTPNDEIVRTLTEAPEKMLGRNNGIVFKANDVKVSDDSRVLTLVKGSIVNGCQTAMCLVEAATTPSYVLVKVVQTSDAWDTWDITKAANHQNEVDQIDLDIASSLRPQLAKRAAVTLGVQLTDNANSVFQIIDDIYTQRVAYTEVRLLFMGLFSRTPNNLFAANYTELMKGLMKHFYNEDRYGTRIFEVLFALQGAIEEGIDYTQKILSNSSYSSDFDRLYKEHSLTYRCFIGILAICAAININIAVIESKVEHQQRGKRSGGTGREDDAVEYERMKNFLKEALIFLQTDNEKFLEYYLFAAKVWMDAVSPLDAETFELKMNMFKTSRGLNFTNLFGRVCREADIANRLRN